VPAAPPAATIPMLAQDWCAITNRTRYWFPRGCAAASPL
jgi:hypothetical protein